MKFYKILLIEFFDILSGDATSHSGSKTHCLQLLQVSQVILDKCGIWGSLMAGILVAKIARYITKFKVDPKLDLCVFASACFKGQFMFRPYFVYGRKIMQSAFRFLVGPLVMIKM